MKKIIVLLLISFFILSISLFVSGCYADVRYKAGQYSYTRTPPPAKK